MPAAAVPGLLGPLPLPKLRQLGGKFGEEVMQVGQAQRVQLLAQQGWMNWNGFHVTHRTRVAR